LKNKNFQILKNEAKKKKEEKKQKLKPTLKQLALKKF